MTSNKNMQNAKPQPLAPVAWLQCMGHSDEKEVEAKTTKHQSQIDKYYYRGGHSSQLGIYMFH